jgi:predicted DCC family thiol-disulfide oxidoreductase YuxK
MMIIFFDGVCNLCNNSVQFIIKRDKKNKFKFASLQSSFAKNNLSKYIDVDKLESIVLLNENKLYTKSTAALLIARELSGMWPIFYVFIIIPPFIRDWFYNVIAKNRYRIFGKKDSCMIPSPAFKEKFLDT